MKSYQKQELIAVLKKTISEYEARMELCDNAQKIAWYQEIIDEKACASRTIGKEAQTAWQ